VEGDGFEISVPRWLAWAPSLGGEWRRREPPQELDRLPRPTTVRMIRPRRAWLDANSDEALEPRSIRAELGFRIHLPPAASQRRTPKSAPLRRSSARVDRQQRRPYRFNGQRAERWRTDKLRSRVMAVVGAGPPLSAPFTVGLVVRIPLLQRRVRCELDAAGSGRGLLPA
jgi:hypothetical protein